MRQRNVRQQQLLQWMHTAQGHNSHAIRASSIPANPLTTTPNLCRQFHTTATGGSAPVHGSLAKRPTAVAAPHHTSNARTAVPSTCNNRTECCACAKEIRKPNKQFKNKRASTTTRRERAHTHSTYSSLLSSLTSTFAPPGINSTCLFPREWHKWAQMQGICKEAELP